MMNIFDRPCYHIKQVKKVRIPKGKRKKFNSKSMLCAWVTKLCPARCESCFFKSNMNHDGTPDEKYQFSEYGVDSSSTILTILTSCFLAVVNPWFAKTSLTGLSVRLSPTVS